MPELHLEVLPPTQRAVWEQWQAHGPFLNDQGYYLAGGTAIALQLGHRQSVDFDFFTTTLGRSRNTQDWLQQFERVVLRDQDANTLHAEVQGVKVSFISGYKYPTLEPLVEDKGVKLASLLDLGLMKLLALTHRATLRDYIDLAALLRDHLTLEQLVEASPRKYGAAFNVMVPLRALAFQGDLDPELPVLLDQSLATSWQQILREALKKVAG